MIGHDDENPQERGSQPNDGPNTANSDYEIGYRRPPKSGQFKPGQSGNPRGRKKREPTVTDRLKKELARKVPITEHGKRRSVAKLDLMFMTLSNAAAKGDLKAINMIISLLTTQAHEKSADLNTDVMSPEDLAMFESFLSEMDVGEPIADSAHTSKTAADYSSESNSRPVSHQSSNTEEAPDSLSTVRRHSDDEH
jgi:hypothetical protein